MFSVQQKRDISSKIQQILRDTGHPELPEDGQEIELSHTPSFISMIYAITLPLHHYLDCIQHTTSIPALHRTQSNNNQGTACFHWLAHRCRKCIVYSLSCCNLNQ